MDLFKETEFVDSDGPEESRSELLENLDILRKLSAFAGLPMEIIKLYAYIAKRQVYRPREMIFTQGEPAFRAHVIVSGRVRLFTERNKKELELQELGPSNFFGYMSLLADFTWPLSSQAAADTELLILEREGFRRVLVQFPEQCVTVVERLVQMRIRRMRKHMQVLMDKITDEKDVIELLKSDQDKG